MLTVIGFAVVYVEDHSQSKPALSPTPIATQPTVTATPTPLPAGASAKAGASPTNTPTQTPTPTMLRQQHSVRGGGEFEGGD